MLVEISEQGFAVYESPTREPTLPCSIDL